MMWENADKNKDGKIDLDETEASVGHVLPLVMKGKNLSEDELVKIKMIIRDMIAAIFKVTGAFR